jgi:TolA-binding protein
LRVTLEAAGTPPRRLAYALVALAAVVLVAGAFVLGVSRPLSFTADGAATAPETWIAAPSGRAVALAFSDGTALRLEPSSRARVVAIDEHGASIALENGVLHAEVVHTKKSAWRVIAGPLTVHVTGTRFDLRWSASTEEFSVTVSEGSVAVAGSALERTQAVRAGETLRVAVAERRFELANGRVSQRAADATPPVLEPRADEKPVVDAAAAVPSAAPLPTLDATVRDDWRELARRGLLRKAFAAAEAGDFAAACRTATPAELLELGDAARLSGRADRATQALLALRTRYPSDPRRSAAAFALGKVAFDQSRAYAQAAEWFATSIREQPSGSLAREASGRLIEAYRSAGNAAAAERAARAYLERYPEGPHADVARSVVRSSRSP